MSNRLRRRESIEIRTVFVSVTAAHFLPGLPKAPCLSSSHCHSLPYTVSRGHLAGQIMRKTRHTERLRGRSLSFEDDRHFSDHEPPITSPSGNGEGDGDQAVFSFERDVLSRPPSKSFPNVNDLGRAWLVIIRFAEQGESEDPEISRAKVSTVHQFWVLQMCYSSVLPSLRTLQASDHHDGLTRKNPPQRKCRPPKKT